MSSVDVPPCIPLTGASPSVVLVDVSTGRIRARGKVIRRKDDELLIVWDTGLTEWRDPRQYVDDFSRIESS